MDTPLVLVAPVFAQSNTEEVVEAIVIPAAQVQRVYKVSAADGDSVQVVTGSGSDTIRKDTDARNYESVCEWAGLAEHHTRRSRKPAPKGA